MSARRAPNPSDPGIEALPARSRGKSDPGSVPLWRQTLRFEDAPDVLEADEAAILLRIGSTGSAIYELVKEQVGRLEIGAAVPNPIPVIRFGRRILIFKSALLEWLARESGTPA